jgi:hypothetical protein
MKNSRLLTIVGAVTVIAGSSAAAIGPRPALAGTTACGAAGIAGMLSCTYRSAGTGTFTVPPGVRSATFTVEGAQGGASAAGSAGGRGGKVSAVLPVTPGQALQVNVGGQGQASSASGGIADGAGGGGSSDVRSGLFGPADRLLVAGGGGGGGGNYICPCASHGSSSAGFRSGHGQVMVTWQAPTTMTATPAAASLSGDALSLSGLSATLTGPSGPVAGQPVTFTAGSRHLCTATTGFEGTATCGAGISRGAASVLAAIESLGYTATYAGDMAYQGATAAGGLSGGDCGCGEHDAVLRERALQDVRRTARVASREDRGGAAA